MDMISVIELTQKLIQIDSITPNDKGCQQIIAHLLEDAGFKTVHKRFEDVDNLFAWHCNNNSEQAKDEKSLLFVGHTDVVPTGESSLWNHPPFAAAIKNGIMFGRGTADMKSAVAAFTLALIKFVKQNPEHKGKVSLMLTSDEEGVAKNGIKKMMPYIAKTHRFDYCLVGEPSSAQALGDTVRIGRRGSLHVLLDIHGKQGHVAYPQNAVNPVFRAAGLIDDLSRYQWDEGNSDFPPTSFQISSIRTSTNTSNIIPKDLHIQANFRFSPESSQESLDKKIRILLEKHQLNYTLNWELSGLPFHSKDKELKSAINNSIKKITSIEPCFNTAGGTSDGRFIAPYGVNVVELGVINKTIHQINENVLTKDIENLERIYLHFLSEIMS